jgi:methylenetetrahydrofolate reductase (NADPH)
MVNTTRVTSLHCESSFRSPGAIPPAYGSHPNKRFLSPRTPPLTCAHSNAPPSDGEGKCRVNALASTASAASTKNELREFVRAGSTEVTTHDEKLLDDFARIMPAGYTVYVAHTPKATLDEIVRVSLKLQSLGFMASPHIIARRVESTDTLRKALKTMAAAGVEQVLVVAGDRAAENNCFASSAELLASGVTLDAGIRRVGVAGHPEGHPAVSADVVWAALERKQAWALRTGTRMHIATQFGFDTRTFGEWERELAKRDIRLPVYAGVAGPTPLLKLMKYAMVCGVGASLKAVSANSERLGALPHLATKADEMLLGVFRGRRHNPNSRILAPHFFAFGGVLETARWLRSVVDGAFELDANEGGFSVT